MKNKNLSRQVKGSKNPNYKEGNRISGMYSCPKCGIKRHCEKRNAWRKCMKCHVNRPSNFSRKEWHKQNKLKTKQWAMDYKGGKCVRCGVSDLPLPCYQFHHIDRNVKEYNPGRLIVGKPNDKLKKELAKCILVCANCHAIIEHMENDSSKFKNEEVGHFPF